MKKQRKSARPRVPRTSIARGGTLYRTDALSFLRSLPDDTAQIIFLDPPFNLQKVYGAAGAQGDSSKSGTYFRLMMQILHEADRVLAPGGALYLYHLPRWALVLGGRLMSRLDFRHWIAVSMKNGFVRGDRLYPAHYALLFFTKGEPSHFVRPKVPIQLCRHCGKSVKDYGGYKKFLKNGINISDIWDEFSPVRHAKRKHRSANELPLNLLRRIVSISGKRGSVLVDPFVGTGSSLVAAVEKGMTFLASDREQSACEIAAGRVRKAIRQLRTRKHG